MSFGQSRNRLFEGIQRYKPKVAALTPQKYKDLDKTLDIDTSEFVKYQDLQARAHAMGIINSDEAMTIYQALNHWKQEPLEVKIVVTQTMGELAKAELGRRR